MDDITVRPPNAQAEIVGPAVNPYLTLLVTTKGGQLHFDLSEFGERPHPRVMDTVRYLRYLHALMPTAVADSTFLFQTDDNPVDIPSVSWESRRSWTQIRLVPDIYYFQARGYGEYLLDVPAWKLRRDIVIWRGATTGILGLTIDNLDDLPRYKLAKAAAALGPLADVGINSLVQSIEGHEKPLLDRLQAEGLMRDYLPLDQVRYARYFVDIDGNANSWNFIQKLRLGTCLLKVESDWRQWFQDRLAPWNHYVPVAADLSDFAEKLQWCRANPRQAELIAHRGKLFGLSMDFDREMQQAAATIFG